VIFDVTTSHTALIAYRTLEAFYVASVVSSHRYTSTRRVRSKMWFGLTSYQFMIRVYMRLESVHGHTWVGRELLLILPDTADPTTTNERGALHVIRTSTCQSFNEGLAYMTVVPYSFSIGFNVQSFQIHAIFNMFVHVSFPYILLCLHYA
jgi:hypothetical protein